MAENESVALDESGVTQEQVDNAPEYGGAKSDSQNTGYSHTQNEIKPEAKAAPEAAKAAMDPKAQLEFTHNGKQVKGTLEQVLKWAQQGYDYPQKMQQFNQQTNKWNAEKGQWEQKWGQYKQIDEYAQKNPQWWNTVKQQWETRGSTTVAGATGTQATSQPNPYEQKIQSLETKLNEFGQIVPVVQQFFTERQQESMKREDQALDTEIKSIRDKYKDLDFDTLDETGKSLEYKVLEHAKNNGIKSFQTAFRDLCHDQIIAHSQQAAKVNMAAEVQKNSRLGILGKSPTPQTKSFQAPTNIRKQSYENITQDALAELAAKGIRLTS